LAKEKEDEETYSLIFSSLKHPIRRKILRMLRDRELTFSEILETLEIDSGHLSYHLENLGDLATRNQAGKYRLSSFGNAAVRLMGRVEEYDAPAASKPKSKAATFAKVFSVVLALTLLVVSAYCVTLVTSSQAGGTGWSNIPVALAQNQSSSYPINFTRMENSTVLLSDASSVGITIAVPEFASPISQWTEYYPQLGININQTHSLQFNHTYLNITVRDSKGKAISSTIWGADSHVGSYSGWVGAVMTSPDSYRLEVRNLGPDWFYANIGVQVLGQYFQRPLFYYGLIGLTIASSYLFVFFLSWRLPKRRNALSHD
jgi:hypothetical protein